MGSIEALWLMRSSQVGSDPSELIAPSIIILETQRLFGGDSAFYYIGNYEFNGDALTGTVSVKTHTFLAGQNVFGMPVPVDHIVNFVAKFDGTNIVGVMKSENSELVLDFQMVRLADLP